MIFSQTASKAEMIHDAIAHFDPQLIIFDIRLESADGRMICDELKSDKTTAHVAVILLTELSYKEIAVLDCLAGAIIGNPISEVQCCRLSDS